MRKPTDTAITGKQWGNMRLVDDREAPKGRRYTLDITIWASNGKTLARRIKRLTDALAKSQLSGGPNA